MTHSPTQVTPGPTDTSHSPTSITPSPTQMTHAPSDQTAEPTLRPTYTPTQQGETRMPTMTTHSPTMSTPSPTDSSRSPTLVTHGPTIMTYSPTMTTASPTQDIIIVIDTTIDEDETDQPTIVITSTEGLTSMSSTEIPTENVNTDTSLGFRWVNLKQYIFVLVLLFSFV